MGSLIPAYVLVAYFAIILSLWLDIDDEWWYFFLPLIGSATVIIPAFLIVINACEASVRCCLKSKLTVRFAHKVAYRTGMHAIFMTFGIGLLTLMLSLGIMDCNIFDFFKFNFT